VPEYNILKIAGSCLGSKRSEETRHMMSASRKGVNNPMFGRTGKNNPMFGKKHPNATLQLQKLK